MRLRPAITRLIGKEEAGPVPWLRLGLVVAVIVGGIFFGRVALHNDIVRGLVLRYGYAGVFVVALISGFNLLVPVPAFAFVPLFIAAGLDFAAVLGFIVAGVTVADMAGFFLGRAGRGFDAVLHAKAVRRLEKFRARHRAAPLVVLALYAAFAPLPNQVVMVPLGLMGYAAYEVFLPLLAGNFIFNALAASGLQFLASRF